MALEAEALSFRGASIRMRESGVKSFQLLHAVSPTERVPHLRREIPAIWRSGGSGENEGALVGGDSPGQPLSAGGYLTSAAHVSGARGFADHVFSARRAALDVPELQ